jgi:hypothetical protein
MNPQSITRITITLPAACLHMEGGPWIGSNPQKRHGTVCVRACVRAGAREQCCICRSLGERQCTALKAFGSPGSSLLLFFSSVDFPSVRVADAVHQELRCGLPPSLVGVVSVVSCAFAAGEEC